MTPGAPDGDIHPDLAGYLRLMAAGRPFAAHEALETAWRRPGDILERAACAQALIQVAAAYVHRARGNARGAAMLARRAAERLALPQTAQAEKALRAAGIEREALAARLRRLSTGAEPWPEAMRVLLGPGGGARD